VNACGSYGSCNYIGMEELEENKNIDPAVEAVLFACGDPVSLSELCLALDEDRAEVLKSLARLRDRYALEDRGVRLLKLENSYQLCTATQYAPAVRRALKLAEPAKLSRAAIEVLLIVANYQPTTQKFIDAIRGGDSSYWVAWLLDQELLRPVGKLDRRGQPNAYATTLAFLKMFHLGSLAEVPSIAPKRQTELNGVLAESELDELAELLR